MSPAAAASTLALPELLAPVSLAIDLGVGVPIENDFFRFYLLTP